MGEERKGELLSSPNGTNFYNGALHINTSWNIIITWKCNGAEKDIDLTGITIVPTDITSEICITTVAKGLGTSDISRTNKLINNFFVNVFKDYVPDFDLN